MYYGWHIMDRDWTGYIWVRKEVRRTTWKFRLALLLLILLVLLPTRAVWLTSIGRSIVHEGPVAPGDVIILENYDENYLVFKTAARLQREGLAERAIVPTPIFRDPTRPGLIAEGFVEVMTRVSRLREPNVLPVRHSEPITLNVALQVAEALETEGIEDVIVVSPTFRSRRSLMVYESQPSMISR